MAMHLTANHGLPPDAIRREDAARDTLENAAFSLDVLLACGWQSMHLVTDETHMPRALWCFRTLARRRGQVVDIRPAPVPHPRRFRLGWWSMAAWEVAALPVYAWRLWRSRGG